MLIAEAKEKTADKRVDGEKLLCYHCGIPCLTARISIEEKAFCCDGCKLVYELLNNNGLCNYYDLQTHPGLSVIKGIRKEQFAFLDEEAIASKLFTFTDGDHAIITFYIPGVHCSSCMWLLENLHRINEGITESRLNFSTKEATIHFSRKSISLRQVAELLATVGYEPYISLSDDAGSQQAPPERKRIYRLGIAGFCFSFIMMMSFPEYFGGAGFDHQYATIFRSLNLVLALPVFFYCAGEFFGTAWRGLKAKVLNIDAPIALAILITFTRSLYEILSGSGGGYLDSMSGIVFFMLVGRVVQERTYRSISFHRDYKSYFPIAVTVLGTNGPYSCSLHDLKEGDLIELHHEELIPADGKVVSGNARIDYSFVTGESEPVQLKTGAQAYAGGRQIGEKITVILQKPVAGSYLTSLWNDQAFSRNKAVEGRAKRSIHSLSRYFTATLFLFTAMVAIYWIIADPSKLLNSVTAMLIVACPCALLLASTFTNGNLLRLFSDSGLFLRDATVIEQLGKIDHIVFDKTGTLTQGNEATLSGTEMPTDAELGIIQQVTRSSQHPYSKALCRYTAGITGPQLDAWEELPGHGIRASVQRTNVFVGNAAFTNATVDGNVHARIGDRVYSFVVSPRLRAGVPPMIEQLHHRFQLSLLSGDHYREQTAMRGLFGNQSTLLFEQSPKGKLEFIQRMQEEKHQVLMVGDGLNDAGALQQSDVGITLTDDVNNFTPACDAILDAKKFNQLPAFLGLARAGRQIINVSFAISICYNLCGLFFAVQGKLSPMIAAILMPASTLSIVLLSTGLSALAAKRLGLSGKR